MTETWIQTYTGKKLDIFNPDPDSICIEDIAHALSMICRFAGHISEFYSVAQHSILLSSLFEKSRTKDYDNSKDREYQLQALLHDSAEAYIGDIPAPIKKGLDEYREIENNLLNMIFDRFNIRNRLFAIVDIRDKQLCMEEGKQLGKNIGMWHNYTSDKIGTLPKEIRIIPWSPNQAKNTFLTVFEELAK